MNIKNYLSRNCGEYSIQNFPVENLLDQYGCTSCLNFIKTIEEGDLQDAFAFVFSIYLLIHNIPEELPDDIRKYVENKIKEWGLDYKFDNRRLERGLREYFFYTLPRRVNGDRDIVFSRIREAGYSYLRFAQEICKHFTGDSQENWKKVVDKVKLADGYGNEDDIEEIRRFFSNLTQNNFEESFIEKGYPAIFAEHLKQRLNQASGSNQRSAWNLLETGVGLEYRNSQLFFAMPEVGFFNSELKRINFTFQIKDQPAKYCCYSKKSTGYRRCHLDANIPVTQCLSILRDGTSENVMPEFIKEPIIIWDVEKKCHKKLASVINLAEGREYVLFPTLSFQIGQDIVKQYSEEQCEEKKDWPISFTGNQAQTIVITAGMQEYRIVFNEKSSLLDYNKIIDISPDKRKYRYFSDGSHPFRDDIDVQGETVKLRCAGQEREIPLDNWQFPEEFLFKSCDISIWGKTFKNLVFFSEKKLQEWSEDLRGEYPINVDVPIPFAPQYKISAGETCKRITYNKRLPVIFSVRRNGGVLQIAGEKKPLAKEIKMDMRDFRASRLIYLHGKKSHTAITSEVSVRRNNQFVNYIAAHKVTLPCTSLDLLNVSRSYDNYDIFSECNINVRLFFNKAKNPHGGKYNCGIFCPQTVLEMYIGADPRYPKYRFILTDYTSEKVIIENDEISHPIPYTLSIEKERFLYCLPVEKQDGEFVKIAISESAHLNGDTLQQEETVDISNIFSGELENVYGVLTFFVYEKNGCAFRYSPGFFLANPQNISVDGYSPLQKALCSCKIDELNEIFATPGNGDFIEKVFANAEKINAAHFFNLFFNKLRNEGKYILNSSFAFRAADYWIPAAFALDDTGNYTLAQRRLNEHWDFELFGYEETKKYLPDIPEGDLLKLLKGDDNEPAMGSIYYLRTQVESNFWDAKFKKLHDNMVEYKTPLVYQKIVFLTNLFTNISKERLAESDPILRSDIFESETILSPTFELAITVADLAYALDEIAYRIHEWKKSPHLSDIANTSNWDRKDGKDPYYYTEQYLRGELVYWRNMSSKENGFEILRDLLLARIAEYAKFEYEGK